MTQADLFEPARARRTDPWTSHAAAEQLTSAAAHYAAITRALKQGHATIYQLADRTSLSHVQIARRLPEMEKAGSVRPTGETAAGPTGRQCRLWAAA